MEKDILEIVKNNNEIVEIDENEEINKTQYDLKQVGQLKPKKKKKPSKWSKLSKKKKIIIIVSASLLLLVILGIILYFVFKKDTNENSEPLVVIEKDNYRYEDGKLVFIGSDKEKLGSYTCENKKETLCYVAYYADEDDFDIDKKVDESGNPIDNRSDILQDNFVFIYDNNKKEDGKIFLYDIKKGKKIDTYSLVKEVKENYAIVKKDNEYTLIEALNKKIETFTDTYEYMGYIEDTDALIVASNNKYSLIDFDGKKVSEDMPGFIKAFDDNSISVSISNNVYIYDYEGNLKTNTAFDYIRFVDAYAIAADGKKLFIFDKDGSPMNIEGIKISSDSYNTKLIFNDELRQIGKEEAFVSSISGNIMKIEFDDEVVKINLNEGLYNKTMEYINYFSGKLYIYLDSEKTNLLGTYTCSYANNIENTQSELDNCFIAKESNILNTKESLDNGYLPIYNKRYIFISDTKTPGSNDNIILYDLESKKKLATYKEVDAGYHDINNVVNFVDTAGLLVVAKNTSDSYGVINIASSKINGVIPFKYGDNNKIINTELKILDNNYLFKRNDGTYHLYSSNGTELTSNITTKYEIVSYKDGYIMVKNDNLYLIYDKNGKIISDEFSNILLEENFYITINKDNVVGVYKYDSKLDLTSSLESKIKLNSNNLSKELNYTVNGGILRLNFTYNGSAYTEDIMIG